MSDANGYLAKAGGVTLTPGELLGALRRQRQLHPLVSRLLAEKAVERAARAAGLSVGDAELQQAANSYRRARGLEDPEATRVWLAAEGLTADDLEAELERRLLAVKFRDHLATTRGPAILAAQPQRFARARIARLTVASADAAGELLQQIREDGKSFAAVAKANTHIPTPPLTLLRCQMHPDAAAAVFAANEGDVVGPFPGAHGTELIEVQAILPAEADELTRPALADEAMRDWAAEQLGTIELDLRALEKTA